MLAELVDGIKQRMKGLAHVHLRILSQLATRYGDEDFVRAGEQAMRFRAHNAHAIKRLLEHVHVVQPDEPIPPLTRGRSLHQMPDDVDCGSLDDYADLDQLDDEPDDERSCHDQ